MAPMSSRELVVLLQGEVAGILGQKERGDLVFEYDPGWSEAFSAYPLSLSLPLARPQHEDANIRPYLEGLLPDDDALLRNLARQFQISPRNPFALLSHLGEDCAGAVQFIRPERLDTILEGQDCAAVNWRSDDEIAEELRALVEHRLIGRGEAREFGYFSLAGAQPKIALYRDEDRERWGIPSGALPTTHILKPPAVRGADGFAVNEHFCLRLANACLLRVPRSEVRSFAGETAIVVERYDRARVDGQLQRLHQEDACQALSVTPLRKYEFEGGPGAVEIIGLLRTYSEDPEDDIAMFLDALALNWAIAGTDAHAKNYSVFIEPWEEVRLAPLYDIVSMLPYPRLQPFRKLKLAMRIGKEYHVWKIGRRQWTDLAGRADLDPSPMIARVEWMLEQIRDATPGVAAAARAEGLDPEIIRRLEDAIERNTVSCLRRLTGAD